jgi:dihydrofolate reductase
MARFLYSATMSLDGFIAGPDGDMSWLTPLIGPNSVVDEVVEHVGALLVGHRTFTGDDPHRGTEQDGKPFGGGWHGPQFVLTRRPPADPVPGVTFVDDLHRAVALAAAAAGDKYVNVMGAATARACLRAGVLDEILAIVAPVLLGDGVRLFHEPGAPPVGLERLAVSDAPLATNLWFRVTR